MGPSALFVGEDFGKDLSAVYLHLQVLENKIYRIKDFQERDINFGDTILILVSLLHSNRR